MARYVAAEIAPGPAKAADAELDAYIRATCITVHHPLGTCRMGPDADRDAVVGADLTVEGSTICASSTPP